MVKLSKSGKQYRITIPQEIIEIAGWDENTEILFTPLLKNPESKIGKDTPIFMRRVK
ncbi:hypothetical protein J4401_03865 [Candidatus Woesearchaeota archaeon]|nr:hypothetical protein [Candidatus Woesearchaeota archaeon]